MGASSRKGSSKVEEEETALVVAEEQSEVDDLFAPAVVRPAATVDMAGAGIEELDSSNVTLPRVTLLQQMSKAVTEGAYDGAEGGVWWLTPHNRPITLTPEKKGEAMKGARFIVVRMYPTQRHWNTLEDGGGLLCEAPTGKLVANSPEGRANAKIAVSTDDKGEVAKIAWEGGVPTSDCRKCVFGLGAAAAAAGQEPSGKGNAWLPKLITVGGKEVRVPDNLRAPACTTGLDALVLVVVPPTEEMPTEVMPAFINFSKSSLAAGRTLGGMIRMASREPAWGRIYELNSKKTTNEKGTFFVATVKTFGVSTEKLCEHAAELFEASKSQEFRPSMDDPDARGEVAAAPSDLVDGGTAPDVGTDAAPLATDQF